jgi:hypothetical protein
MSKSNLETLTATAKALRLEANALQTRADAARAAHAAVKAISDKAKREAAIAAAAEARPCGLMNHWAAIAAAAQADAKLAEEALLAVRIEGVQGRSTVGMIP